MPKELALGIYIVLIILSLGIDLERHGKERVVKTNFWASLIASTIIVYLVLSIGGFIVH